MMRMVMVMVVVVTVSLVFCASLCLIEQFREMPVHCLMLGLVHFRLIVDIHSRASLVAQW